MPRQVRQRSCVCMLYLQYLPFGREKSRLPRWATGMKTAISAMLMAGHLGILCSGMALLHNTACYQYTLFTLHVNYFYIPIYSILFRRFVVASLTPQSTVLQGKAGF